MSDTPRPGESAVWDALRTVLDPEVGENIVDLGLVYRVETRPGAVAVDITMTTPACRRAARSPGKRKRQSAAPARRLRTSPSKWYSTRRGHRSA